MSVEGSYNFLRVSALVTTSGVVGAERLGRLGSEGYDMVINLLPDDSEYAVADEADIITAQDLTYAYIPVDFAAPDREDLEAFSNAMDDHGDKTIHVHCAANFRVTAFYGLYAVSKGLLTAADADDLMRRVWDPADHPVWAAFIRDERDRMADLPRDSS